VKIHLRIALLTIATVSACPQVAHSEPQIGITGITLGSSRKAVEAYFTRFGLISSKSDDGDYLTTELIDPTTKHKITARFFFSSSGKLISSEFIDSDQIAKSQQGIVWQEQLRTTYGNGEVKRGIMTWEVFCHSKSIAVQLSRESPNWLQIAPTTLFTPKPCLSAPKTRSFDPVLYSLSKPAIEAVSGLAPAPAPGHQNLPSSSTGSGNNPGQDVREMYRRFGIPLPAPAPAPSLSASALAAAGQTQAGSIPREVLECERLANSPSDPQRRNRTVAVEFKLMDGNAALAACQIAVRSRPNSGNLRFNLGRVLQRLGRDHEAYQQHLIAAQERYGAAMGELSVDYYFGRIINKDLSESLKWAQAGAELNDPTSMNALGVHYEDGWVIPFDLKEALRWYDAARKEGNEFAAKNYVRLSNFRDSANAASESNRKFHEDFRRENNDAIRADQAESLQRKLNK
jgi:hypothetical protein